MSEYNTKFEQETKRALEFIDSVTRNADKIQRDVLCEILNQNANVEYLQKHGLGSEADLETFKRVIPVITYEDFHPYIERIANGEMSPIFCSKPIILAKSSGTSRGQNKMLPLLADDQRRGEMLRNIKFYVMSQVFPGIEKRKAMYFYFTRSTTVTTRGRLVESISNIYMKSKNFKNGPENLTSLYECINCPDLFQSLYSQLLCGLYQNTEVSRVGAHFVTRLIQAVKFLENHWQLLCHDIRTGSLNPQVTDPNVREAIMRILKPNPSLADFIKSECSKDSWEGIITRLWPNAKCIETILTGAMAKYVPTLEYYTNTLPLVSLVYVSTECFFGLNLNPLSKPNDIAYTIFPNMAYFEFLPVKPDEEILEKEELVDLVYVKLGKEYELVVTTYSGLYRYRVGDILRVAGFKNKAPQFHFVGRKNVVLSVDAEKIEEDELQNAVTNAASLLIPFDATLLDYTSYSDSSNVPGHYVLFWEIYLKKLNNNENVTLTIPTSVIENCCLALEESLNTVYRNFRAINAIGPLEIRLVENGTFEKLMDYAVTKVGASPGQYKTPLLVKSDAVLELLNSKVVSRSFSPRCPEQDSSKNNNQV